MVVWIKNLQRIKKYRKLVNQYEFNKEQSEIKSKLASLESKVDKMKLRAKYIRDFISNTKQFTKITKLTPEILRAFVKRIEVYGNDT